MAKGSSRVRVSAPAPATWLLSYSGLPVFLAGMALGMFGGGYVFPFFSSSSSPLPPEASSLSWTALDDFLPSVLKGSKANVPAFAHKLHFKDSSLEAELRQLADDVINKTFPSIGYTMYTVADDCPQHAHTGGKCDAIEGWTNTNVGEYDAAQRSLPELRPDFFCGHTNMGVPPGQSRLDPCPQKTLSSFVKKVQRIGAGLQITHMANLNAVRERYLPALERITGRRAISKQAFNMFYTSGTQIGSFGWHFDAKYDVLLFGLVGRKRFRVAGYKKKHSPVQVDIIIEPGTALVIPAGFYHNGIGLDPESLILSVGFTISSRN